MNKIFEIKDFSFKYSQNSKLILDRCNYTIQENEFHLLIGPNGAGKSTLFNLIQKEVKDCLKLGQKSEDSIADNLTLFENSLLYLYRNKRIPFFPYAKFLKNTIARMLKEFFPIELDLDFYPKNLSGGEKQIFSLFLVFLTPPKLLLLDEHTSALDPQKADSIFQLTKRLCKKHNASAVVISHSEKFIKEKDHYDAIYLLKDGKLGTLP